MSTTVKPLKPNPAQTKAFIDLLYKTYTDMKERNVGEQTVGTLKFERGDCRLVISEAMGDVDWHLATTTFDLNPFDAREF